MPRARSIYKTIVKSITVPLLTCFLTFLDGKKWMPVFYFLLTRTNTNDILLLHVLHNIREKTGRRVLIITGWPIWPRETKKDPFHRSFITGLTPRIKFIWIPQWLHQIIKRYALLLMRVLLVREILYKPMAASATFRYSDPSTMFETDILNDGEKVVLEIPQSHEDEFENRLRALGISPGQWYVCIHARDNGWSGHERAYGLKHVEGYTMEADEHRNVDIQTYFPAVNHIISQGGIVVRMGDSAMEPINGIEGVIDYPFTEQKSLPMDLYLVSRSKFVIGCEAGFTTNFPVAFGIPLLVTNLTSTVVTSMWPYNDTRVMLKPVQEINSGRILSLRERSVPSLSTVHNSITFRELGYKWLPNTPEEILESTKEMLELVQTDSFNENMTTEQIFFDQILKDSLASLAPKFANGDTKWTHMTNYHSRISATFASRHFQGEARNFDLQQVNKNV